MEAGSNAAAGSLVRRYIRIKTTNALLDLDDGLEPTINCTVCNSWHHVYCLCIRKNQEAWLSTRTAKDLSHVPCKFHKVGMCTAGSSCPFSHSTVEPGGAKDVCVWFVKGNCKFGHKCALAHVLPGQSMAMDRKNKKAAQIAAGGSKNNDGGRGGGGRGGVAASATVAAMRCSLGGPLRRLARAHR
jgi:hypothetical protein